VRLRPGSPWEKVSRWFGYKLHLLVDSEYELPLAFDVAKASSSDMINLMPLVEQLADNHPELAEGAVELSADKGYDSKANNAELLDDHDIKPVIDKRELWSENHSDQEASTRSLFADRVDSFIYDEQGQVYCVCPETGEQRELTFCGYEADRRTLKYRCPLRGLQKTLPSSCQWLRLPRARKLRGERQCGHLRPCGACVAGTGPQDLHTDCSAHLQMENSLRQAQFGRASQLPPRLRAGL